MSKYMRASQLTELVCDRQLDRDKYNGRTICNEWIMLLGTEDLVLLLIQLNDIAIDMLSR